MMRSGNQAKRREWQHNIVVHLKHLSEAHQQSQYLLQQASPYLVYTEHAQWLCTHSIAVHGDACNSRQRKHKHNALQQQQVCSKTITAENMQLIASQASRLVTHAQQHEGQDGGEVQSSSQGWDDATEQVQVRVTQRAAWQQKTCGDIMQHSRTFRSRVE
jgi:hypothetical protein